LGEVRSSGNIGAASATTAYDKSGYAVGAGIEYMLNNRASIKSEYMFLDFDRHNLLTVPLGVGAVSASTSRLRSTVSRWA
jgi:opacity protein-like surface antigen